MRAAGGGSIRCISSRFIAPETYTPKYLAEKILTARGDLEGERKQMTVLFADIKGSTELIEGLDPEEAWCSFSTPPCTP